MGPYRPGKPEPPRCVVLCGLSDTIKCCQPCDEHTILDSAICDECWEAVRLPSPDLIDRVRREHRGVLDRLAAT